MSQYDYDLLVIGAGSAGVRLSRVASSLGAKVAVVEDRYLGGTCVNVGCVPKKLFVYASEMEIFAGESKGFGWSIDGKLSFDWNTLLTNKNKEIGRLNSIYESLLTQAKVTLLDGRARFIDKHHVKVNSKVFSARNIAIATGSWPVMPEFEGVEHAISSNEFFFLDKLPKTATVVGGGYIAVELAGILNGLGVNTTLVYRGELFLRGFDEEIRHFVKAEIKKKGVHLQFNENIKKISPSDSKLYKFNVEYLSGQKAKTDLVLCATGRSAHTQDLDLENVSVDRLPSGHIKVNECFQTSEPSIFALGDVTGGMQLTPVAIAEGMALAHYLFADQPIKLDYKNIPTAVFCQPNIATVGFSEEEAREKFRELRIYTSEFRPLKHTLSGSEERSLMKLIVDVDTDKVVGVHMVGHEAGEIIQGIAIAIKAGATKQIFDETVGIHPTAAEEFVTMRTLTRN
jgi:glutathione reductase (NADPH)